MTHAAGYLKGADERADASLHSASEKPKDSVLRSLPFYILTSDLNENTDPISEIIPVRMDS